MIRSGHIVRFISVVILAACVSCLFSKPLADTDSLIRIKLENLEKDYPDASAIFILNEANLELFDNKSLLTRHLVIKILNRRGIDYANVSLPYAKDAPVTGIRARTILGNGTVIPLPDHLIYDINLFPDFIFYSDARAKRFTMPSVETGCIVEYEWTQRLPKNTLLSRWDFQKNDPVLNSTVSITSPNSLLIKHQIRSSGIPVDEEKQRYKSYAKYRWHAENIPPLSPEIAMPMGDFESAHILFNAPESETWKDAAAIFYGLAGNRYHPDESIRRLVSELTADAPDQREQLRLLFEYVRDNIRYIAIEIGIGGYQPHASKQVLQNRYGDCKDMTGLLISMASVLGIDVSPALISNWFHGPADTSIVNLAQFNHVIAYARLEDGSAIWMDPTEKYEAFGSLPWYDQNRMALIADRDGLIAKTPGSSSNENISERFWSVDFYEDGQATGTVELRFKGAQANELRRQLADIHPRETTAWFGQELLTLFPVQKYYVIQIDHLDGLDRALRIHTGFISTKVAFRNGDLVSLYPGSFSAFEWARLFPAQDRQYSVALKHPLATEDEIRIRYPENWQYLSGFQSDSLVTSIGKYAWSLRPESDRIIVFKRSFRIDQTTIQPSEYKTFTEFLSGVASGDQTLIQFKQM